MTGPGVLTFSASGSVTDPGTYLPLALGTAASTSSLAKPRMYGLFDPIYLPSIKGMLLLNGIGLNFHSLEGSIYTTGVLGVASAIVATSTATRASGTITFTAATRPADGDQFDIQSAWDNVKYRVTFKTTLSTTGQALFEIARGANLTETLTNIQKLFNGTAVRGTHANFFQTYGHIVDETYWTGLNLTTAFGSQFGGNIECTGVTATVATLKPRTPGTQGNSCTLTEITDAGGTWSVATFSGGAAGTGSAPAAGTYGYRSSRVRTVDGATSYASPIATTDQFGNYNINLTSFVAAPTRDQYDFHRWWRTPNGGSVFFRGADVAAGTGEPYVDSYSDDTITGAFALKYDDRAHRPYTSGYPVKCRYGCFYKGRVFAGGAEISATRSSGTVSVTASSFTVTFTSAAHPTVDWIGRTLKVGTDAQTYIIVDVNEATRACLINLAYGGSNNATASYVVTDDRNPFTIYYSEPEVAGTSNANDWPTANELRGRISSTDASGISGMKEAFGQVWVWTQTNLFGLSGDTGSGFVIKPISDGCGAYSNQAIVNVSGSYYWIGANGIFYSDGGSPKPLSRPQSDVPIGIQRTLKRINQAQRSMIVGNFNPTENVIRWWVPLDGSLTNRDVIVYDLSSGSFSMDTCEEVVSACTVADQYGVPRTLVGDSQGGIFQLDYSVSDGAFGFERIQTASSYASGTNTVTVSGTPYPTSGSGLSGLPFIHVAAADGAVQRGKVRSNTNATLTFSAALTTAPVNGDTIIVGPIWWDIQTGRFDMEEAYREYGAGAVTVTHVPSTGQFWCALAKDNDTPTVYAPGTVRGFSASDSANASTSNGYKLFWFRRGKARRLCVRLFGFTTGTDFGIVGWLPVIVSRDSVAA